MRFNLNKSDITRLTISENDSRNNCYIHEIKDPSTIYTGFILSSQHLVEVQCDVSFYKPVKSDKYIPHLTFRKILKSTGKLRNSLTKNKVIIDIGTDKLGNYAFWKMVTFLKNFKDLISPIDFDKPFKIVDKDSYIVSADIEKGLKGFLETKEGPDILKKLLKSKLITSNDIVNTGYRKEQLEIFRKLLFDDYLLSFKKQVNMEDSKDESTWQYFFNKNQWIFGYGLDYRFQGVLQKEFHSSSTDADGSESVIADFLLGDKRFTTFVELKKPETPIFAKDKNRSMSWKLSDELIHSVSQILEQKASGQIKLETTKQYDDKGKQITQKSYDSKVILVIGSWTQIKDEIEKDQEIKRKTFELYRRDSRNIEFVTYDELYERAKFIVEGEQG